MTNLRKNIVTCAATSAHKLVLAALLLCCGYAKAQEAASAREQRLDNGQTYALKNNLIYDATLTPNLGLEIKTGSRSTMQLFYGINPWNGEKNWKHWVIQPEVRHWFNLPFRGWFVGAHLMGGEFNVSDVEMPFGLLSEFEKGKREEGWFIGGGISAGYQWELSKHWHLETGAGIGYDYIKYDRYKCGRCGELDKSGHINYFGPTKLALSVVYLPQCQAAPPQIVEILVPVEKIETPAYVPRIFFVTPPAEPKVFALEKRAYIDFPVDKTELHPSYRRNPVELDSIVRTINMVKNDPNITIDRVTIHGYASPESSYDHNDYLARERAKTLKDYVRMMVNIPDEKFATAHTAEDWEGLRRFIEDSNMDNKAELLAICDNTQLSPDERERRIKTQFPLQYTVLLTACYPSLRHSDYRIAYTVRSFTVDEAKTLINSKPQQLSLNELYLVAQTYEAGSAEFNEVMEIAVRMFPDDEYANLNAACTRLLAGDAEGAKRYIGKAGNSPQAINARAAIAYYEGDYTTARRLFSESGLGNEF